MTTIKARIAADNLDMAGVPSVTVFGHALTQDYAEIEVSEAVVEKLKGNPCIDVLVRKLKEAKEPVPAAPEPVEPVPADVQPQG